MTLPEGLDDKKARASARFSELRDRICASFEELEDRLPAQAPMAEARPGRFVRTPWERTDHSGAK
ncbi:MAG: coproporphyrinogen III oxidase, partial [Hyphomicrobiales bacterium]|nr:coproporphyrinogen III oxidase [Hyphomicrobiales bacterium]